MKRFSACLPLFVSMLLASGLRAQEGLSDRLPFDHSVRAGKLANGLQYFIRANRQPQGKAELRLVVNAGSILEDNDQQGLAHFTEHMAFNGTTHFAKNELVSYLQNLGIEFGADLNAQTGFDETTYILPVPLSDPANLGKGLQVLQDWAQGISFENSQIEGERGVVLEESRLGKGAEDRMFREIYPRQYAGSRYAIRLPIGKDSLLKVFPPDAVRRFYKTWYRPNLMAVVIVGDVDPAGAEKLIHKYFDGLKNPSPERQRSKAILVPRLKSEAMVVTDKEATNFGIEVDFPFKQHHEDVTLGEYRHTLVRQLFTAMLDQRLGEKTQSARPPYLFAGAGYNSYARGYEGFTISAVAGKSGPDTALSVMLGELSRARTYGFTADELERAKSQALAAIDKLYNDRDKTESSGLADELIRHFLTGEPVPGTVNEHAYYHKLMPGITLAEVNAEAAASGSNNDRIFVTLQGPAESNFQLPSSGQLLASAESILHQKSERYVEHAAGGKLFERPVTPGKITGQARNSVIGTSELRFANGARVILKPTDFKSDEVVLSAFHKGGISQYGAADRYNATYASAIVSQMGVDRFTPVDLRKMLAGKVASVAPSLGQLNASLSGSSSAKDLVTLLQLTNLYLTSPRRDDALFAGWKQQQQSMMQFAMADPTTSFVDTVYKELYRSNPLAPIAVPRPAYFDSVSLDRALEIYREQFGDATDFTFILTGNIDTVAIRPLLETYIGSLPGSGKAANFRDNGVRAATGVRDLTYYKGKESKSMIVNFYSGDVGYTQALDLRTAMLVDVLNIRVIEILREKLGGVYTGGFQGSVAKNPYGHYNIILFLPCGPENVGKLTQAAAELIDSVRTYGPDPAVIAKVKKTWLEQHRVKLRENGYWSGVLNGAYFDGTDPARVLGYEERVNAITADDLKQTAALLFDGKNILHAVLYPEKK